MSQVAVLFAQDKTVTLCLPLLYKVSGLMWENSSGWRWLDHLGIRNICRLLSSLTWLAHGLG